MQKYRLPLNKATLIFFPPQSDGVTKLQLGPLSMPRIAQVIIKQEKKQDSKEWVTFFNAQNDITAAIESIIMAHILSPLPANDINVEGEGYSLYGVRKEWEYGKRLNLTWGGNLIRPCKDKWIFTFKADDHKPPL